MQRRATRQPYTGLIILIVVCFTISCLITQICYHSASVRVNRLSSEKFARSNDVELLKEQLSYVRSDAYVERIARDEFGLIKPGEIRYVTNG